MKCPQTLVNVGQAVSCELNVTFESPSATIQVDYGDGFKETRTEKSWTSHLTSGFGAEVPRTKLAHVTSASTGLNYLALNAEINRDCFLRGIEFYVANPGKMNFGVRTPG